MSYIHNFKKFLKNEEKETEKLGANPSVEEQAEPSTQQTDAPATPQAASPNIESDPAVISARQAVAQATTNRDKVIAAKQKELNDLKISQDALVNTATTNLNTALANAAKNETSTT